ncbi:MAG: hypothetical protein CLLPBCKN_001972 [Chroococcidiopsis cubana SAG 39.79]|jgi:hypothetical protein|uniref:Uncharacterized protein n=2 Tax=Chroococcidiopsis TaxID=54298 RepID=K9TZK5_CHRTP|nr:MULTISPECIES: hypothetical protein [Chroococcidiopsis]PSB43524.1 hypothetical protein C7B80_23890 [Cyanosarcina cf. burmensis CCALA 770]AFY88020.1 hypothetical protein Chro_2542 [Chroococcidiopsis thermalis PCC 7203]MDZ4872584.1 hypothetical protein [Chroococcidiopsis cubana SAG 39.79]PSB64491.1 hypothetical protein C7B79_09560 [Chroococcidiopsis cubana CCALA 043]RUT13792.1 hypothetical protein DSM107010_10670 [Chroococcidiopsis cubana SAG 39.79]
MALNSDEFKHRLLPQATTLVEKAVGTANSVVLEALLDACYLLENSSNSNAPIVAIERDVRTETGTYHLFVRRLSTSVPAGKFQILIVRELASGLIQ